MLTECTHTRILPIRIGEIAHDFRFEASGTLKGYRERKTFLPE